MAMAKKQEKTNRRHPLIEFLFPEKVREISCCECGRPYLEHPERTPTHRFVNRDVELLMYVRHSRARKEYWLRVGAWRPSNDGFRLHQLFNQHEVAALLDVVVKAFEFIKAEEEADKQKMAAKRTDVFAVDKPTT